MSLKSLSLKKINDRDFIFEKKLPLPSKKQMNFQYVKIILG